MFPATEVFDNVELRQGGKEPYVVFRKDDGTTITKTVQEVHQWLEDNSIGAHAETRDACFICKVFDLLEGIR